MSYSQGIAQFANLFAPAEAPNAAAVFLAPLAPAGSRVLDIGAGTGGTAFALAAEGCHVSALEPDPEMFAVLLSRLALRHELHERVTPVPRPAGFRLEPAFDLVSCCAVVHLLQPEERLALVAYAARQLRPGGRLVLEIPIASASRAVSPWQCIASRQLGAALIEHHSAMEPDTAGWWYTHWAFKVLLAGEMIQEVRRSFHWYPLPVAQADALLAAAGLTLIDEFGGFDRAPFVPDESRVRLLVAGGV
jgi:SAM-dependent methyltransferase